MYVCAVKTNEVYLIVYCHDVLVSHSFELTTKSEDF